MKSELEVSEGVTETRVSSGRGLNQQGRKRECVGRFCGKGRKLRLDKKWGDQLVIRWVPVRMLGKEGQVPAKQYNQGGKGVHLRLHESRGQCRKSPS